jgi:hypothetical protein
MAVCLLVMAYPPAKDRLPLTNISSGNSSEDPILAMVRRPEPAETPDWVNRIPDRIAYILVEKHLYKDGPVWGLAKQYPDQELPYDEVGSCTFIGLVGQYDLFDRVGQLDEESRTEALAFWQSWQDPNTGRFLDPQHPERQVNEKYVVSLISSLGGEPKYPWTTTSETETIETDTFLARTEKDPDWQKGGWGVGSHTCFMALEIYDAINQGQTELIPDLQLGLENVFSHQDPSSGLWGSPDASPVQRIGGALKVVGRLYFRMGMTVPHTRELADTIVKYQKDGTWFENGANYCVPRNVAEVAAYCIEVSDYRRAELLDVLEGLAEDYYKHWLSEDGSTLMERDNPDSIGINTGTIYALGIIGGYLNWQDCRLPNPLKGRERGAGQRYQVMLEPDGGVKVLDTKAPTKFSYFPSS